jgi:eukaryotic-like serine/threonine-protein kinase
MTDTQQPAAPGTPEAAFAELRRQFHELLDLSPEDRATTLAELQALNPDLAEELGELLHLLPIEPAPASVSGMRFGPFIAGDELGRGGMAVVYRAARSDGSFAQTVALKLLHAGTRSRAGSHRFLRERRVLARLEHPNIARLIDAGVADDGRLWLAMEFVDGADLHTACAAQSLPTTRRIQLLAEVCDAVSYAHSRLVLHRDLKPANIRLGLDGRPRLLDFGIARLLDETDPQSTATGFQLLTPRYAAPEQLRGEAVTTASDVYALGVILRELCLEPAGIFDPILAAVVERACAAQAADRYSGAAALAEDLRDWLGGRSLRSGVGSRKARALRWLQQHRWPLGTALAVLLALAAGGVATWHQADLAAREASRTRAHLHALLDVVGAASPQIYAGRDPPASAFLVEAARRLQAQPDVDAELLWLSLNQIGNGLINLGHSEAGRDVLQAALVALDRDTALAPALRWQRRLDNLRLLVLTTDEDADLPLLRQLSEQISTSSAAAQAPAEAAIGALAVAAGACSRLGEFELSQRLLDQAASLEAHAQLSPEQTESYWRQRGWVALRARQLDTSEAALQRSLAAIDKAPQRFSAMRRAETHWLLAALALQRNYAVAAASWLNLAAPVYAAEYPQGNPELAMFRTMQAHQALLEGDAPAAVRWLEMALPVLHAHRADEDLSIAQALLRAAQARLGDCSAALDSPPEDASASAAGAVLPNRRFTVDWAETQWRLACSNSARQ